MHHAYTANFKINLKIVTLARAVYALSRIRDREIARSTKRKITPMKKKRKKVTVKKSTMVED